MNAKNEKRLLLPCLVACSFIIPICRLMGQSFTTLHEFSGDDQADGAYPRSGLVLSVNTLYGTTSSEGPGSFAFPNGTVFKVNTDGTGYANIYAFNGIGDGKFPQGTLTLSGNTLYGTTIGGGIYDAGTVFAINTDGTGYTNIYSFTGGTDGVGPYGALLLSGNTLYGTTYNGGDSIYSGTVFAVNTDGTGFTVVYNFTPPYESGGIYINPDGLGPRGGLVLSGNTLFGTAVYGGTYNCGTIFSIDTDTKSFQNLHTFTGLSDGAVPFCYLVLSGNTLYGATEGGGTGGSGTLFAINTDGSGFTNIYNFTATSGSYVTNSDGANPVGSLLMLGHTLYGTAYDGGCQGDGAVFSVNTDGTGFLNVYNFTNGSDGANPATGLIFSDDTFYGTTVDCSPDGVGTVFRVSFRPELTITPSLAGVILSWPTNEGGFDYSMFTLQSCANLSTGTWISVTNLPVVINGKETVTDTVSCREKFYRLGQ